jgi:O-antigen/teichoic acid export membrane protein
VRKNFFWITLGNSVKALSLWGVLLVLARLTSVEMVGVFVLARAVCAPIVGMANLGLRGALITDARNDFRFADYFGVRVFSTALMLLAVAGLAVVSGYETQVAWVIMLVAVGKAFESLSDIFHGLLQQRERMDRIGIALMIRGPLGLLFLVAGLVATGDLVWGMFGFSLAWAITFLAWDLPNGARIVKAVAHEGPRNASLRGSLSAVSCDSIVPRFDPRTMLKLAWLSLPLGVVLVLISLSTSIPRYMIDHYLGRQQLGIYAAVAYPALMASMVVAAMGQSACPRLAKYHAAGQVAAFCRLLGRVLVPIVALAVAGLLLVVLFGRPLLALAYGPEYAAYTGLAVWVMIAAGVRYLTRPLAKAVDATRRFKTSMVIRAAGIALLAVLLPFCLKGFGLIGAPVAALVANLVLVVLYGLTLASLVRRVDQGAADRAGAEPDESAGTHVTDAGYMSSTLCARSQQFSGGAGQGLHD